MCGIVGYVGHRQAAPVILDGLKRLEYRGYDSAGVVVAPPGRNGSAGLQVVKRAGKLGVLAAVLAAQPVAGKLGLGHTRWATHGKPNDINAHPHLGEDGKLAVIHNGIIENYLPLRERLAAEGHLFASETDTEVLVHLIESHYAGDLVAAVRASLKEVEGAYALVVSHAEHDLIVAARATSPMVLGLGEGENFVASDIPALLPYTRRVVFLHDGDMAVIDQAGVTVTDFAGRAQERPVSEIGWDAEAAEKGGYEHYMLKEIYEQPAVLQNTFGGRFAASGSDVQLDLALDPLSIDRVIITAAGTAFYSGLVGEYLIEALARLPVEVEVASEFRYRSPVVNERTLCIVVSQSGETIDTLEALREAKRRGAKTLAVLNVKGSSISREAGDVLYIHAGPEIGVASTKAYLAMVAAFELLALWLGRARAELSDERAAELIAELRRLPKLVETALETRARVAEIAESFKGRSDYLFLGRGVNYPTALEGALKLKEISYIHAEGYATGEMKHGPIALIDERMPVVIVATASALYDKTVSNIQEVKARDGVVIALASEGDARIAQHADYVITVPETLELVSPLVNVIPLQLLAYETAHRLGLDVDQPRNLAKSVTVE
ncbi:MAG: glutamine--fructose-6-phosphate transaminase (isomerizing) [Deinococcota bacterium]|nr:glutamine--fructose-6-phosphate transaminase (isomerizing) [Deinococcota bacterium]